MNQQRFRMTEYLAPAVLVLIVALGIGWMAVRLWRESSTAPPEPQPGASDYRLSIPAR